MFETLKNAWKIPELKKKILYTLLMLLVYRLLCFIPTPGVDREIMASAIQRYDLLSYLSMMTGDAMSNMTIMAMGITPYINSSIIMQLLCVAIPKLEELNKSGEEGRKKIAQITRYVTVGLGFVQAVALVYGLKANILHGFFGFVTVGLCLAAGTALAMWIGERITDKGIGNGVSLLIFAGIVARFATSIAQRVGSLVNSFTVGTVISTVAVVVISLALIVGVVLVDLAERRIPVQYAKRMVGRKMYGGQSTHIPIKLNASGVLPLIFASAIMQFPGTILQLLRANKAAEWWTSNLGSGTWWYIVINTLLILGFTFFYSSITFNPKEMADNIQNNGGLVPGIRQGKATVDYITKINNRITLFGALFLAFLNLLPSIVYKVAQVQLAFAGSSLLIAVSVAVETARTLESQLLMRHYKGFLK